MSNLYSIKLFYKLYLNAINLLEDRKYKYSDERMSYDQFSKIWIHIDDDIVINNDMGTFVIFVSRNIKRFVKDDFLKSYKEIVKNHKLVKKILFSIGPKKSKNIMKYKELKKMDIEFIQSDALMLNLPRHDYVPKHILLTNEQKREVLTDLQLDSADLLPKILITDAFAVWYGAKVGDIFKIIRLYNNKKINMNNNFSMDENVEDIAFRVVVKG